MRLPEGVEKIERYVDYLEQKTVDLDSYVIVGDSLGALVAMGFAIRRPTGLAGLVLSGGFVVGPDTYSLLKNRLRSARMFPGPFYKSVTLRRYAESVASPSNFQ